MLEIVVPERSGGKNIVCECYHIEALHCNVLRVLIPIKKRLKRKYKAMLCDMRKKCDFIVGTDPLFSFFCQKNTKTFMHFYPRECVAYITRCANTNSLAFYANQATTYFLETVYAFGKHFPYITVYTENEQRMKEAAIKVLNQNGLPIRVKVATGAFKEKYILQTDSDFTVLNTHTEEEYADVNISFSGRLTPFLSLPLREIVCIPDLSDAVLHLLKTGEIKIVGVISK